MAEAQAAIAHHFDDLKQQRDAAELGMWIFLATEVMFFGGLFLAYTIYRLRYEEAFAAASHHMDLVSGTVNTAVLLTSSLTVALAVQAAESERRHALTVLLLATVALGAVFLAIKFHEYQTKYEEHLVPFFGLPFDYAGNSPGTAALFFELYFL